MSPAAARVCARVGAALVRGRFLVLAAGAAALFVPRYLATGGNHPAGEWLFFKAGAFGLTHETAAFTTPALHLYEANPQLQIGPPPLLVVAVLQHYLTPAGATLAAAVLMAAAGIGLVRVLEQIGVELGADPGRVRQVGLAAGLVLVGLWTESAAVWRHLDDVMALSAITLAVLVTLRVRAGRGRLPWWVAPVLLGLAAAAKPWAVVFAPLLVGLPRPLRARAVLTLIAAAAVWWAPFVLAAPGTLGALGGLHLVPDPGSVPYLVGLHADVSQWLRPVQFGLGLALGLTVALRRSWLAVPFVALALRVGSDPYTWSYYGLGPLLVAAALDLSRRPARRDPLPYATLVTAAVFYLLPAYAYAPASAAATGRLLWCVAALLVALRMRDDRQAVRADAVPASTSRPSWLTVRTARTATPSVTDSTVTVAVNVSPGHTCATSRAE